jgi:tetratricopeptide (TPR) repeat protein
MPVFIGGFALRNFKSNFALAGRLLLGAAVIGSLGLAAPSYGAVDATPNIPGKPELKVTGADAPGLRNMVEQAQNSLRKGDVKTAIIYLKNAVSMAPKNGQVRAELGYLLLRTGDAISAERELRQARADGASDQMVLPSLFQAMLTRGKERDLLEQFPEPAQDDKSVRAADVLRARAIALQKIGQPDKASAAMDRSLSIRRDAPSLLTRASLAQQQGDLATAMKVTDEALKLAPTDAGSLMMKISLLQAQGQDDKALGYADQLVKYYPDTAAPKVARIGVYLKLKQDAKAQADVKAILAKQPGLPIGVYYEGIIKARAKDIKGAWKLVQGLPPEFVRSQPAIGIAVAQIALDSGNKEVALSTLASVVAQYPQDAEARLRLGALKLQTKSPQQALDVLDPLKNSKDPRAAGLIGQAYARLRQYGQATEYFEKAAQGGLSSDILKTQLARTEIGPGGRGDQPAQRALRAASRERRNGRAADRSLAAAGPVRRCGQSSRPVGKSISEESAACALSRPGCDVSRRLRHRGVDLQRCAETRSQVYSCTLLQGTDAGGAGRHRWRQGGVEWHRQTRSEEFARLRQACAIRHSGRKRGGRCQPPQQGERGIAQGCHA